MRGKLFTVVVSAGVALAADAVAQSRDENWQQCANRSIDPDVSMGACTAIIQSGLESDANLARAFTNRSAADIDERQIDRALRDLDQAIQLDRTYVLPFKLRGDLYGKTHRNDRAIADYDRVVQLNPNDADAYGGRGLAYYSDGQYDRAIHDCSQAIGLNPNDAMSFYVRGLAKQESGDIAGGNADIATAQQINPNLGQ